MQNYSYVACRYTPTHLQYNTLHQETVFLGRHHEVVRLALVVDDILKVNVRLSVEVAEELLVEDERYSADLLDTRLLVAVVVDEVGGDSDRQLTPELLPSETCSSDDGGIVSCRSISVWGLEYGANNQSSPQHHSY